MIKIKDGDVYRILPIITESKKIIPFIYTSCIYLPNSRSMVYDIDDKILYKSRGFPKPTAPFSNGSISKRYFLSVIYGNQVDWIFVGNSLIKKIQEFPELIDINLDYHLKVNIKNMNVNGNILPNYDGSEVILEEWQRPFDHKDPKIWGDWLIKSQLEMWQYLNKMSVKSNIDKIKRETDLDLSHVISEIRNERLDLVLN